MTDRVRVGVIGVGGMGANHARVYSMLRTAELVGIADTDPDALSRVGSLYGVRTYTDHRELLSKVEAASVAVPTQLHVPMAIECLQRGVHVLVEKPIAPDIAEGRRLIDEAARRGAVLQVGHVERFNPAVREAARIASGERVLSIAARRLSPPTLHIADDVVVDLMIHDIDVALSLARSGVRAIRALGAANGARDLHLVFAHLLFDNGILADLAASKVTHHRVRELEVTTERSLVAVNYRTRDLSIYRNASVNAVGVGGYQQEATIERPLVPMSEPLYLELEHFLACVRGSPPQVRPEEHLEALEIALRIRAAALASL